MQNREITIDTALADIAVGIDHLGAGIRQLVALNQQQPIDQARIADIRALESLATEWLIAMEDIYAAA